MTECDDELQTADTELLNDSDILAEFRSNAGHSGPDDNDLEEEDEVLLMSRSQNAPQNKNCAAPLTCYERSVWGLSVEVDIDSFTSNIRNISRIIDSNRLVEKRQGILTSYFSKSKSHELCSSSPMLLALPSLPLLLCFVLFHVTLCSDCIVPFHPVIKFD